MIVVLGRPALSASWRSDVGPGHVDTSGLAGRAARIALAASADGAPVELVGAVGDDPEGDQVMVQLGQAGVGHAAVLRDPSARTPVGEVAAARMPRLEPADISLGLSYVAECRVLVIAEPLPADAIAVAAEAAAYHGAALVAIVAAGGEPADTLPADATVLEAPTSEPADGTAVAAPDAFDRLVARYAVALHRGDEPAAAFRSASHAAGWEAVSE